MIDDKDLIVDVVITWVNGNDPAHKTKMQKYLENKNSLNTKFLKMRFNQINEIEFTVKSILKYAKFVRNIFIVTDNQIPDFLKDSDKAKQQYPTVSIVDHKDIFSDNLEVLPTFNSRTIETQLYKIPNLAEHFIYFNDDCFVLDNIKITDFFKNGLPVLRGKWHEFDENLFIKKVKHLFVKEKKNKQGHKKAQQKGAKIVNFKKYFKFHHTPHPLRKSTLENFYKENDIIRLNNIKYKFRNGNQYLPQGLANHLEIKNNTCILVDNYRMMYFQNYKKPFWWLKYKLRKIQNNKEILFLCMQSLDQCPDHKLKFITDWLHEKYD